MGEHHMNLLRNIKIRSKLFVIIIISALALSIVGIQGVGGLSKLSKGSEMIVNIEMINQGSSEVSMMFGVKEAQEKQAVRALYQEFFAKVLV
ncbi:hypothetical protein DT075_34235 [Bacillus licheniformis]|nr:hypothetical protein DT075_34235 [Bacillus licheniformis]